MTGKERFEAALAFIETDRPPHFEAMFEIEEEAFGLKFPDRNSWEGCMDRQKAQKLDVCLNIYSKIVERYQWDALMVYWPWSDPDGVKACKKAFGDTIAVGGVVGMGLWSIDSVEDWVQFSVDLVDNRQSIHDEAEKRCRAAMENIDRQIDVGADFVFLPHDVAFNAGPFVSPADFAEIVTPYLARLVDRVRSQGIYAIFHSDGMLMPVLDQILECKPHVLHSIDPMAGMDISKVKRLTQGKMALMGNVQCSLLQDGPDGLIRQSCRYCLEHAASGGGYIYSSSNTIFPGMPLRHYEIMLEELRAYEESR